MPEWEKMIPYLRVETLKNHIVSVSTYLSSPYLKPRRGATIQMKPLQQNFYMVSLWMKSQAGVTIQTFLAVLFHVIFFSALNKMKFRNFDEF